MNYKADIIIVGGGGIGLCTALELASLGMSVIIIESGCLEKKGKVAFDGRNIALNDTTISFLSRLGVWNNLKKNSQAINDIIVSDGSVISGASDSFLHFDHRRIGDKPFGYFVLYPYILKALTEKIIETDNIKIFQQKTIKNINITKNHVELFDNLGTCFEARLVIGADGKNSHIRNLSHIDYDIKSYHQTALVCSLKHDKPHHGIAQEYFLPSGPFAILPMPENHTSIVWIERDDYAKALLASDKEVLVYEIERRFGLYLGNIQMESNMFSYPLVRGKAKTLAQNRILLVGDAAHTIHPISGQGYNLGIRDVMGVSKIISQYYRAGLDFGSPQPLNEYHNERLNDIEKFMMVTDGLNRIFSNSNPILRFSRRVGLDIVNHIPKLREFISKSAMQGEIN